MKDILEAVNESAATPSQSVAVENVQRQISEIQKWARLQKHNVRQSQSRRFGM
jgi:hypothetical protein